jgi:hypothetical protein
MLLRRTIENLRKQEWTAIAIDFVIVVVGVFLASQVTNWNAARMTHERAREVTARLLADVHQESLHWQNMRTYYAVALANGERAAAITEDGVRAPDEEFLIAAYRATQYLYYGPRRAAYDEVLSTGDIGIVTDPELREAATLLFNSDLINNATRFSRASEYRSLFRRSVPASVQLALRTHCGDRVGEGGFPSTQDYTCTTGLAADEVSAAAAALRRAPSFIEALRQRVADLDTIREDLSIGDGELNALVDHYAGLSAE